MKWSDASYVEDQDQWWHGGIHREVFLVADRRRCGSTTSTFGPASMTRRGTLEAKVRVAFTDTAMVEAGWRVEARLETESGRRMLPEPLVADVASDVRPYLFQGHLARVRARVPRITPWSAETPQRYRLLVSLVDPGGRTVEVVEQLVGFRTVEVRDRQLLVNGATGDDPRGESPRSPSRSRSGGDRRRHACRPCHDEASQRERGPLLALSRTIIASSISATSSGST